jgi:ribonuclease HI
MNELRTYLMYRRDGTKIPTSTKVKVIEEKVVSKNTTLTGEVYSGIEIFTDGACSKNGAVNNVGSCGYVMLDHNNFVNQFSKSYNNTTNNRMEMSAVIHALNYLVSNDKMNFKIIVKSDSKFVVDGFNGWMEGWKYRKWKKADGEEPINKDLWIQLDQLKSKFTRLTVKWVKGHSKSNSRDAYWNNYIDELCQSELKK